MASAFREAGSGSGFVIQDLSDHGTPQKLMNLPRVDLSTPFMNESTNIKVTQVNDVFHWRQHWLFER